jgi:hypothetical protein
MADHAFGSIRPTGYELRRCCSSMLQHAFVFFVMAGLRPGHPRLFLPEFSQDVDARDKPGHDE